MALHYNTDHGGSLRKGQNFDRLVLSLEKLLKTADLPMILGALTIMWHH